MTLTNYLRSSVAALALAAFMPSAVGADQASPSPSSVHPLLTAPATNAYKFALSDTVAKVTQDDGARIRTRGFIVELEKALKEPREKARTLVYPKDAIIGQLSVVAVLPPTGMEKTPIGVCLQQGLKVAGKEELVHTNVGTLQIEPTGKIVSQAWEGTKVGSTDATGKFQAACAPYRTAYIQYINNTGMASTSDVPAPAVRTNPAQAQDRPPRVAVGQWTAAVLDAMKSSEATTRRDMLARIPEPTRARVAFEAMTAYVLGPSWIKLTQDQQANATRDFAALILGITGGSLKGVSSFDQIVFGRAEQVTQLDDRLGYMCQQLKSTPCEAMFVPVSWRLPGTDPVGATYRLIQSQGRWTIVDIEVFGVNILEVHRKSFAAELESGTSSALSKLIQAAGRPFQ